MARINNIDRSFFEGEIYLPAVSRDAAVGISKFTQSASQGNLDWFISKYEDKYLKDLLGKIYPVFVEESLRDSIIPRQQELFNLIYQKKPVNNGSEVIIVNYSPAAYYIYYFYMVSNRSQTSMKGEVRAEIFQADNLSITPSKKLTDIWNSMCDDSIDIQQWIIKSRLYDDILNSHVPGTRRTCYSDHFMAERFCFKHFKHINTFSI